MAKETKKKTTSPEADEGTVGGGHEGIRVTNVYLTPEQFNKTCQDDLLRKVYKLIWQRTVASAMSDAILSETTYTIENSNQVFEMSSKELLSDGYRKVYSYNQIDSDESDGQDKTESTEVKETFNIGERLNIIENG